MAKYETDTVKTWIASAHAEFWAEAAEQALEDAGADATDILSERLRLKFGGDVDDLDLDGLWGEFVLHSLSKVDWNDVAAFLLSRVDEREIFRRTGGWGPKSKLDKALPLRASTLG